MSLVLALFVSTLSAQAALSWQTEPVNAAGEGGQYTSLALDSSGHANISYNDAAAGDLMYAVSDGTSWTIQAVDQTGDVGLYSSLALDPDGNPHISYYDASNHQLKYASWDGTSWSNAVVDNSGDVGLYSSLAFDAYGHPIISYWDASNKDLKYAIGNGGWSLATIDSTGNVGQYTSLALDADGNIHISYFDVTNKQLKYAAWNGANWDIETVDSADTVGKYDSLALDASGNPHISYYDGINQDLKYAVKNGGSWDIQTVDSAGKTGRYTSLALDADGNPHISYYDVDSANLKYAVWDGSNWSTEVVDSDGDVGQDTSLALDAFGNPHISYYDVTNGDLKYALTADSTAPVTTATATTRDGEGYTFGDWADQNVTITLTATDETGGSGIKAIHYIIDGNSQHQYSDPLVIRDEGVHTLEFWSVDNAGNREVHQTVTIKIDKTNPTTVAAATTADTNPYAFGDWTNQSVIVTLTGSDDLSGSGLARTRYKLDDGDSQRYTTPFTIDTEGTHTIEFWSRDVAGNHEVHQTVSVNIDVTAPVVTYTGNQGSYTVDQTINITCAASDPLSGVASTTCQNISGPAASFAAGVNAFSATATDNAGNTGSGSVSFTIGVTSTSLCNLTRQYTGNSRSANQLCAPLQLLQLAERMHNPRLKASAINMYAMLVNMQRGRGLTSQEAATLIQLAREL